MHLSGETLICFVNYYIERMGKMNSIVIAFCLTAVAGLSTGLGGLTVFFRKQMNNRFLSFSLGASAGVMIYISFVELFAKANGALCGLYGDRLGTVLNIAAFFCGMAIVAVVEKLIPEGGTADAGADHKGLLRTGVITAVALALHNLPEGLATFVSALQSPSLALPIVVAIAIHNIPEGVAVAVPVFCATGNRKKAFWYSLLSGLTEPLGAIIGYLILMPFLNDTINFIVFSAVAGIMVFISMDELLPAARECGHEGTANWGVVAGMLVMAISLVLFL